MVEVDEIVATKTWLSTKLRSIGSSILAKVNLSSHDMFKKFI